MSVRLLLTDLLLPPLVLVYIALGAVALAFRRRASRGWLGVAAASLALLLVLGLPGSGEAMLGALERGLPVRPPPGTPPQAIVILSAGLERTSDGPQPGLLTLQRLLTGVRLWHKTHLPVLVAGGPPEPGQTPLAVVMAATLENDFHVPVRWIEAQSRTTWENAADSAAILRGPSVRSVYLVTHAWHERRAMLAFRHFGFISTAVPVPAETGTPIGPPTSRGWWQSYYALHEWAGLLVYSLRAWRDDRAAHASNSAP